MGDLNILANRIADWVGKKPDLDVLTFVDIDKDGNFAEETRTYQQLWDNGQRLAAWLKAQGMEKGDAFGVVMLNQPEFVDLMVASSILGTIFVPIDARTKGDKLKFMLDYANCKGVVVAGYALANVEDAIHKLVRLRNPGAAPPQLAPRKPRPRDCTARSFSGRRTPSNRESRSPNVP